MVDGGAPAAFGLLSPRDLLFIALVFHRARAQRSGARARFLTPFRGGRMFAVAFGVRKSSGVCNACEGSFSSTSTSTRSD